MRETIENDGSLPPSALLIFVAEEANKIGLHGNEMADIRCSLERKGQDNKVVLSYEKRSIYKEVTKKT